MRDDGSLARWLPRPTAAAYVGLTEVAFTRRVAAGALPKPSEHLGPRCLRWDRHALDAAMAGPAASAAPSGASGLAEKILAEGRARRHAAAGRR
jgi:predicted DNA-binding transcriptional regulator AlpA